jgi:ABC-type multidrug transport system ATPase subunit
MSAGILKALMQLFAIIAREGGTDGQVGQSSREIVAIFLRQQLNQELVHKYLAVFEGFAEANAAKKSRRKNTDQKRTSLNSVKVLRICTQINEELAQKEKYYVLIRLIEFITAFEGVDEQEWEFAETVADTFNIEREVYLNIKALVLAKEEELSFNEDFLIASLDKSQFADIDARTIEIPGLDHPIIFYRIENENMFFLRCFGTQELFLNGQGLSKNQCHVFNQGSSVRGSRINPIYYSDVIHQFLNDDPQSKIEFRAENVSYYFQPSNKQALHQLNINETSGNLIGIMGGSGSGKSTLLNVLNGNYTPTYGKVSINGVNIHEQGNEIEGVIGYVAQDDLLIEELSVFQNLYYNAKLCFADKSKEELKAIVLNILQQLGLEETSRLKVGSPMEKTISGGQRKRLNIALELIREPAVLFVDEPTSGLSSRDSENIMDLLKELTLKGKLIFVVIHQPSSDIFKMFDSLFLLDQGGYPIYYGNPVESIIYFKRLVNHVNLNESECPKCGNVNPEQLFNIIESKVVDEYGNLTDHRKVTPKEWNNFYNVMIGNHINEDELETTQPTTAFKIPAKLKQWTVFFKRDILSKLSNQQYMLINMLEAPVLAFVLAFFVRYYKFSSSNEGEYIFRESENIPQFLFISVIVSLFLGLTVSAEEIIRDQKILKREKFLNLSRGSYLLSKIGIMFLISAFQSLLFVLIGNFILEIKGMMLPFWMILFSTSCFANMLGLNISASFNSAKVIYILIPILIIPQLLFSGVIVKFDKLNPTFSSQAGVPFIGNIMCSRWAFEALSVFQFKNNEYEELFFPYEKEMKYFNWKKDFWLEGMNNNITKAKKAIEEKDQEALKESLEILYNEVKKEQMTAKGFVFEALDQLHPEGVSIEVLNDLKLDLPTLQQYYIDKFNAAREKHDQIEADFSAEEGGRAKLLALRDEYFNMQLEEFVINKNAMYKIVEYEGELIQKSNPIYIDPIHRSFFGAHFYAPSKQLFGKSITTFSANLLVIWGMAFLLGALLFADGLKRLLDAISNIMTWAKDKLNPQEA